jgi:hypothetical protein
VLASLRAGDPATLDALRRPAAPCFVPAQAPPPLAQRFADLRRHFVFEYYPWYHADPWFHWDQWNRTPPDDIAANHVPRLGPYDSRSRAVIEQHARWIAESGVGAVNLSWWGPDSAEDRLVHLLMDVMRDHDLKVSFHLEPYADDHGQRWLSDVLYLLREYGERRSFDSLLLLRDEQGRVGPLFKGFRTIVPPRGTDCHGVTRPTSDYTPDESYRAAARGAAQHPARLVRPHHAALRLARRHTRGARRLGRHRDLRQLRRAPRVRGRGAASERGRAGVLVQRQPGLRRDRAARDRRSGLLRPDAVRAAFGDARLVAAPPSASARRSSPRAASRRRCARRCRRRRTSSSRTSGAASSWCIVNSFNEWHEGHAFEPMKDAGSLSAAERRIGYHNPERGDYRLHFLRESLRPLLEPPRAALARARGLSL